MYHILLPLLRRGSVPPAFDFPFGHEDRSLFRRVYVRGSRVSTRFVCPRITGPTKTFKASVGVRPSSAYVKGCRTPVGYVRLRRTRPAGVGQASWEETARGRAPARAMLRARPPATRRP